MKQLMKCLGGGGGGGHGDSDASGDEGTLGKRVHALPALDGTEGYRSCTPGRYKGLLIGINYRGTKAELKGCINDVHNIYSVLTERFGWHPNSLHVLTEDGTPPTHDNILREMDWLAAGAAPGDTLFMAYSGHGSQQEDPEGFEEDGMNDTLLPLDFQRSGMVTDDIIFEKLVQRMPEGVSLTCIIDACHSGTAMDLPWKWVRHNNEWQEETNPFFCRPDICMISGCEDHATSSDGGEDRYGRRGGALTTSLVEILTTTDPMHLTYDGLMDGLIESMKANSFKQRPQLSSMQPFDACTRLFAPINLNNQYATVVTTNRNPEMGRIFRKRFKAKPRPHGQNDPLAQMLAESGMLPKVLEKNMDTICAVLAKAAKY
ncbi:unnamed protein product [Amoebophrya sp. A120]|nr:unnamed protein product [Amoebophrya sp. A120]|eukprot:GSA120T00000791001.1